MFEELRRPGHQHPFNPTHGPAAVLRHTNRPGKTFENARRRWHPTKRVGVGSRPAWLHLSSARGRVSRNRSTRGHKPAKQLLGLDWSGTLVHDGWSVYDRFQQAFHQQCVGHLQRRCQALLEAPCLAVRLPRASCWRPSIGHLPCVAWRDHRLNRDDGYAGTGLELRIKTIDAQAALRTNRDRQRGNHILKHAMHWFWFLIDPTIAATNYRAEQAIRPAVVNRKVWGGNLPGGLERELKAS